MRRILGRAAALALIAGLCATIPTAGASSRAHTAPALTLPAHPDGLSRALASGRISPAKEALLRAQALFRPATVAAVYGPIAPSRRRRDDDPARPGGAARRPRTAAIARPPTRSWPGPPIRSTRRQSRRLVGWRGRRSPDCGPERLHPLGKRHRRRCPGATDTTPANGIPDYVDQALATAENVWNSEVDTMGYRAPLSDATLHRPRPRRQARHLPQQPGRRSGLYGYCTSDDPGLNTPGTFTASAYCVVDNNYTERIFRNHTPIQNLKVTLAHEFFHAVQFAYDIGEDTWLMEGTATWMEDQVYDGDQRQPPVPPEQPAEVPLDSARPQRQLLLPVRLVDLVPVPERDDGPRR